MLREGGIYVDTDVKLDALNLDDFITPSLGFFVPRDSVGDFAGSDVPYYHHGDGFHSRDKHQYDEDKFACYCLWNGLMGSGKYFF